MGDTDDTQIRLRKPYPREEDLVREALAEFSQYQSQRNIFAQQWEEFASLSLPTSRNTFYYGNYNWQGQKKAQLQIDGTTALALHRFCALADSLVTPRNYVWHGLEAESKYLMKDRKVRLWYEGAVETIFRHRYAPTGNFVGQNFNGWQSVGAFGNSTMFVDKLDGSRLGGVRGLRYRSIPLGETFFGENHQGIVDRMIRWFRLTAYQAAQKWGEDALPPGLWIALGQNSQQPYDFLHCVKPRDEDDYEPSRLDEKGMAFTSYYVSINGSCLMEPESGYRKFPFAVRRYDQTPGEVYGRGPGQIILAASKTLNAQKATSLKVGHRNADPVYIGTDEGLIDFNARPGAYNAGGVNGDGRPLVHTLPAGNYEVSEKQMAEERSLIDDTFLGSLYKTLVENPNMKATQVIEIVNERAMLVSPTLGRQHDEYVAQMADRELDLLIEMRLMDPMPPLLAEAVAAGRTRHRTVDTSPLAKQARASGDVGTIRVLETAKEIVNITGNPAYLDWFDGDVALPSMARNQLVPESYIANDQKMADKRTARAKAQQAQQQIESMPGQAAMINAQTKMQKAQPGVAPGASGLGGPQQ